MEIAGLAVGGIALSSLFDQCMSLFQYIDTGRNCSRDYQRAALKVALLARRLKRWEESWRSSSPSTNPQDGLNAKRALQQIHSSLEQAAATGERYGVIRDEGAGSHALADFTHSLQTMTTTASPKPSLVKRGRWALHDKNKLNEIIVNIKFFINELETLSLTVVTASVYAAGAQAANIVHSPTDEDSNEVVEAIAQAAADVDPDLGTAIDSYGHQFRNIEVAKRARVQNGDIFAKGATMIKGAPGHNYDGIKASNKARIHNGNLYGGRGPFDDLDSDGEDESD